MHNLYSNTELRLYLITLLNGRSDLVDDLIGECCLIILSKYDIYKLSEDGSLPYVLGKIAKNIMTRKSSFFRKKYLTQAHEFIDTESKCLLQLVDDFKQNGELTNFEKLLIEALETADIKTISRESGISYKMLRIYTKKLKKKYDNYRIVSRTNSSVVG